MSTVFRDLSTCTAHAHSHSHLSLLVLVSWMPPGGLEIEQATTYILERPSAWDTPARRKPDTLRARMPYIFNSLASLTRRRRPFRPRDHAKARSRRTAIGDRGRCHQHLNLDGQDCTFGGDCSILSGTQPRNSVCRRGKPRRAGQLASLGQRRGCQPGRPSGALLVTRISILLTARHSSS